MQPANQGSVQYIYSKHVTDNIVDGLCHVLDVLLAHCTLVSTVLQIQMA
jgi:hypothetical protein